MWRDDVTAALSDLQASMLDRIVAALRDDERIDALLGGGSLVTGGFDAHSDLDLIVVVRTDAHAAVMAERLEFAASLGVLLSAFTGEHVGEPQLLICLFGPPLIHVDFIFLTLADLDDLAERPVILWPSAAGVLARRLEAARIRPSGRSPQWFEERAWLWLHYGATKLLRGEYFEAIATLDFFRERVLGPLLQRSAGKPQRGVRRVEEVADAPARLRPTLAGYDRAAIARALKASAALYVELRTAEPPPVLTAHMPRLLLEFMDGT
jgi:predicted nucleotidyltransferase